MKPRATGRAAGTALPPSVPRQRCSAGRRRRRGACRSRRPRCGAPRGTDAGPCRERAVGAGLRLGLGLPRAGAAVRRPPPARPPPRRLLCTVSAASRRPGPGGCRAGRAPATSRAGSKNGRRSLRSPFRSPVLGGGSVGGASALSPRPVRRRFFGGGSSTSATLGLRRAGQTAGEAGERPTHARTPQHRERRSLDRLPGEAALAAEDGRGGPGR